jgi:hypothetical protein
MGHPAPMGAARRALRWSLLALTAGLLVLATGRGAAAEGADNDPGSEPRLTQEQVVATVLDRREVAEWLDRYEKDAVVPTAHFVSERDRWEVSVVTPEIGRIVMAKVDDRTGIAADVWVGPEVAWPLARGGGVGGVINQPRLWLAFCLFFLLGLADLRRPLSLGNLDLVAVLSFSVNVALLNEGRVFSSAIAAAASLIYLIWRMVHVGVTNRPAVPRSTAPVWLLVVGLVFLVGLRTGINVEHSTVLDVGYAGVIGADRLSTGESPYGSFPRADTGRPCSLPRPDGTVPDWVQDNGRCESANPFGDTYGPVNYHAYLPGLWLFGWSGRWDFLPAVHFTTLLFDLLTMAGLSAVGRRRGGSRTAVVLAFAWVANPLTQYTSSSNANDSIMAALLVWGFWAASSSPGRGCLLALASWTKLGALILLPLWATHPDTTRRRGPLVFAAAFGVTTLLSFWVLLFGGDPWQQLRMFLDRTFLIQFDRSSPFSLWDWGQYAASGLPDLAPVQHVLQVALVVAALSLAVWPRYRSALQLAAFSAALLMSFQLLLTHWSALYTVWFMPFVLLVVLTGDVLRHDDPSATTTSERDDVRTAG